MVLKRHTIFQQGRLLPTVSFLVIAASSLMAVAEDSQPRASEPFDERRTEIRAAVKMVSDIDARAFRQVDFGRAAEIMGEAAELARSTLGETHWLTRLKQSLVDGFTSLSKLPDDRQRLYADSFNPQPSVLQLMRQGDHAAGIAQLQRAHEQRVSAVGAGHTMLLYGLLALSSTEAEAGELQSARLHASEAVAIAERIWGQDNPGTAHAIRLQGTAECGLGEFEVAEKHLKRAIAIYEPVVAEGLASIYSQQYARAEMRLAQLLNDQKRFAEAEPHAHRATEVLTFHLKEEAGSFVQSQIEIARSLSGQEQFAGAEIIFKGLLNNIETNWPPSLTAAVLSPYAAHLRRLGNAKDAERVEIRVQQLQAPRAKLPARSPT